VLVVSLAVVAFVVWPLVGPSLGFTCGAQEKAAILEFPQYGGGRSARRSKNPWAARY
jgi:hypothetical protein